MTAAKEWEILPGGDLSDATNWKRVADDRFAAIRLVLFINRSSGSKSRYGPIVSGHNVGPGDTITVKRRKERIITHTNTVTEAIRYTASARLLDRVSVKLSAQLGASAPGYSGTIGSELMSGSEKEFTETLEDTLGHTSSFEVQEAEETEHQIVLQGGTVAREAHLRRRFWPRHWDVYVQSVEYLELSYRTEWWWWQVRKTIKQTRATSLGLPLCRLTFYEPQLDLDVCYDTVPDELTDPDRIAVDVLNSSMPKSAPPRLEGLERLAQVAFPTNRREREEKKRRLKARPAPRKAGKKMPSRRARGVKKVSGRKRSARRASGRKR